jgi:hypothetical protein
VKSKHDLDKQVCGRDVARKQRLSPRVIIATAYLFGHLLAPADAKGHRAPELMLIADNPIAPTQVTLSNLETFERQFKHNVATGMKKTEVEEYLRRQNLHCSFAAASRLGENTFPNGLGGNSIHCRIKNIGKRGVFTADLSIRIHLNPNLEVEDVYFRVDYL